MRINIGQAKELMSLILTTSATLLGVLFAAMVLLLNMKDKSSKIFK